jgi:hypothetical protein
VSPKIHPFTVPAGLQRRDRLSLTCSVFKGNRPLKITWSRDPNPDSPTSILKPVQIDDFTSMLTIGALDLAHNGAYTCQAENTAGTASHTAVLQVHGKSPFSLVFQSPPKLCPSLRPRRSKRANVRGSSADWLGQTRRSASGGSKTE